MANLLCLQCSLLLKWNRINLQHHFLGTNTESHKKHPEVIWEHRNTYTYVYNQAHAHKGDLVSVLPPKHALRHKGHKLLCSSDRFSACWWVVGSTDTHTSCACGKELVWLMEIDKHINASRPVAARPSSHGMLVGYKFFFLILFYHKDVFSPFIQKWILGQFLFGLLLPRAYLEVNIINFIFTVASTYQDLVLYMHPKLRLLSMSTKAPRKASLIVQTCSRTSMAGCAGLLQPG